MASKDMFLSQSIQKPSQLRKILRELDKVEDTISEHRIRGDDQAWDINLSFSLDELIKNNDLKITNREDFNNLKNFLKDLQTNGKVLHFSFNQSASEMILNKLIEWLRKNIDPNVLVTTGLNNSLGVGFILRSTNKYFDFSLGSILRDKRELLVKKISEAN